jgi:hypothetical protein
MSRIAILSTSFGFGPVSKAATVAKAFHRLLPGIDIVFFGAGIALEFAARSGSFDRLVEVDVDRSEIISGLLPLFRQFSAVISVLNLNILPLWCKGVDPPLFLVDSLAWMWNEPPLGLNSAECYFTQDYLLEGNHATVAIEMRIPPIDASWELSRSQSKTHLLVNLSGCHNPLVDGQLYRRYAEVIVDGLVDLCAYRSSDVVVCCNAQLAKWLRNKLVNSADFRIDLLPPDEFLQTLSQAAIFVTSPGITTTVEVTSLGVCPRFLLPQNYSQALIAQKYDDDIPSHPGMPLHRFGAEYRIEVGLPESIGVERVLHSISRILEKPKAVVSALEHIMKAPDSDVSALRRYIRDAWDRPGQDIIVSRVAASIASIQFSRGSSPAL